MPFNDELDARVAKAVSGWNTLRKKMFGGTCYLLDGNMLCGVWKDYLILRLGDAAGSEALKQPHVLPFDITGKPMAGWVMVEGPEFAGEKLMRWLEKAKAFVETLPKK